VAHAAPGGPERSHISLPGVNARKAVEREPRQVLDVVGVSTWRSAPARRWTLAGVTARSERSDEPDREER